MNPAMRAKFATGFAVLDGSSGAAGLNSVLAIC